MALENLGLGFAVSWIYNAFAPSEAESSKRAIESASERKATPRSKAKSTRANEGMTPSKDEPLAGEQCSTEIYGADSEYSFQRY